METSVIRTIDSIGRVVLPQELRRALGLHKSIPLLLQYRATTGEISLSRRLSACVFCGAEDALKAYRGLFFCSSCQAALKKPPQDK